ncbi:hypothetical protein [Microlunatus parietis]|uniref:Uncharacterized protein n=1 Tax=Microlunatus parietis TaxID=682979 RepID=A0A7Y9I798_9ACTN|nr:hypothetical protein [Microlunatus parietis]NYE71598.1 hypothetical protein [Microlunatus parietis]
MIIESARGGRKIIDGDQITREGRRRQVGGAREHRGQPAPRDQGQPAVAEVGDKLVALPLQGAIEVSAVTVGHLVELVVRDAQQHLRQRSRSVRVCRRLVGGRGLGDRESALG